MESHVLYEAAFSFEPVLLLIALMPVAALIWMFWLRRKARETGNGGLKIVAWVLFGVFIQLMLFSALIAWYQVRVYQATVGAYRRGEYEIVEGYVENFDPMPEVGHKQESFTIDGVRFEYSDYEIRSGYHNARSLGGVITGDGQHLKIGYTEYNWLGNVIVYIEELP